MNLADVPKEKLSPMMQQYAATKEKYSDCILFFRLGDFYEMFFEDAILVSRELELTLTGKECGLDERAPMCGVPYHSVDLYLKKLVDRGYKIAICEQMTDPALSKGLVERDMSSVSSPPARSLKAACWTTTPTTTFAACTTGQTAAVPSASLTSPPVRCPSLSRRALPT